MIIKIMPGQKDKLVLKVELNKLNREIDELINQAKLKLQEIRRFDKLKILELLPSDAKFLIKLYCLNQCVVISNANDEINDLINNAKREFMKSNVSKELMFAILDSHYIDKQQN